MTSVARNTLTKRRKQLADAKAQLTEVDASREELADRIKGLVEEVGELADACEPKAEKPAKAKKAKK